MFVDRILPRARDRLVTIESGTSVRDAAALMAKPHVDLLVVCDGAVMTGVVTKTDILGHVGRALDTGFDAPVDSVMSRDVAHCHATDALLDVWREMHRRGFQRIPVISSARSPIGVVYLLDALVSLLAESQIEDEQLRDYISGVGYH